MHFVQRAWIAILAVAALTATVLPANLPANALGEDPAIQNDATATPDPTNTTFSFSQFRPLRRRFLVPPMRHKSPWLRVPLRTQLREQQSLRRKVRGPEPHRF